MEGFEQVGAVYLLCLIEHNLDWHRYEHVIGVYNSSDAAVARIWDYDQGWQANGIYNHDGRKIDLDTSPYPIYLADGNYRWFVWDIKVKPVMATTKSLTYG